VAVDGSVSSTGAILLQPPAAKKEQENSSEIQGGRGAFFAERVCDARKRKANHPSALETPACGLFLVRGMFHVEHSDQVNRLADLFHVEHLERPGAL
jgi:hypothetical protein